MKLHGSGVECAALDVSVWFARTAARKRGTLSREAARPSTCCSQRGAPISVADIPRRARYLMVFLSIGACADG
jgi:hypothetical protein